MKAGQEKQEKLEQAGTGMRLKPACISKEWKNDPRPGADLSDTVGAIPILRVNFSSFRSKGAHLSGKLPPPPCARGK